MLHFAVVLVCCLAAIGPLTLARWTHDAPRTALLLWQTIGVAFDLSLAGLLFSAVFAPDNQGLLPGFVQLLTAPDARQRIAVLPQLIGALGLLFLVARAVTLLLTWIDSRRQRARHRVLLDLVAERDPGLPGVDIIDHPAPAAYCLPGRPGRIAISTGTLRLLDRDQLDTVLAHERAHLRGRHHLFLLPLLAWRHLLPGSRLVERAIASVQLLLEMTADDDSCRTHPRGHLSRALDCFAQAPGTLPAPPGTLGAAETALTVRTRRLQAMASTSSIPRVAACALAATLLSTPLSLFVLPL
ncbi:M56 family metallopeptidase [Streptomyces buecherae]|uniref:M56 family metallopeptidase n=1 Tax=Streptomyces buecherae TaxID=2763006 RepID=UPI003688D5DD